MKLTSLFRHLLFQVVSTTRYISSSVSYINLNNYFFPILICQFSLFAIFFCSSCIFSSSKSFLFHPTSHSSTRLHSQPLDRLHLHWLAAPTASFCTSHSLLSKYFHIYAWFQCPPSFYQFIPSSTVIDSNLQVFRKPVFSKTSHPFTLQNAPT